MPDLIDNSLHARVQPIITLVFLLILALTACDGSNPEVIDNLADFANVPSVETDGAILQACYSYANDYLIVFQEIKVVIDAETGIAIGRIPAV